MPRGNNAKEWVANKLIEAFGDSYQGTFDKKFYVSAPEAGEQIQVCISLTCPKTPVEFGVVNKNLDPNGNWDFTGESKQESVIVNAPVAEITQDEIDNIQTLMARLGL